MVYDEKDAYYQILIFYHLDFFFKRVSTYGVRS